MTVFPPAEHERSTQEEMAGPGTLRRGHRDETATPGARGRDSTPEDMRGRARTCATSDCKRSTKLR